MQQHQLTEKMKRCDIDKLSELTSMTKTYLKVIMRSKVEVKKDTLDKIEKAIKELS